MTLTSHRPAQELPRGVTPLHVACEAGHLPTVRALVAAGARVDAFGQYSATRAKGDRVEVQASPLACAARHGHADVVAFLLDSGADPNLGDDSDAVSELRFTCARRMWGSRDREPHARDGCAGAVAVARAPTPPPAHLEESRDTCLWLAPPQELRGTPLTAAIARGREEVVGELLRRRGGQAGPAVDVEGCGDAHGLLSINDWQQPSAPEKKTTPEYAQAVLKADEAASVSALNSRSLASQAQPTASKLSLSARHFMTWEERARQEPAARVCASRINGTPAPATCRKDQQRGRIRHQTRPERQPVARSVDASRTHTHTHTRLRAASGGTAKLRRTPAQGARRRALVQASLGLCVLAAYGTAEAWWRSWNLAPFLTLASLLLLLAAVIRACSWPRRARRGRRRHTRRAHARGKCPPSNARCRDESHRTGALGSLLLCGPEASHARQLCSAEGTAGGAGPGLGLL